MAADGGGLTVAACPVIRGRAGGRTGADTVTTTTRHYDNPSLRQPVTTTRGRPAVDYVALMTFRSSVPAGERDAALMRRAAWQYPENVDVIAEYWPMTDAVQVVIIFSTDDPAGLMELEFEWNDVFDIAISPAVSAEAGLAIGPEVFGRLARMQPS